MVRTYFAGATVRHVVIAILYLTWTPVADAQCEPCLCNLVRMPEIRMTRAIVANCSGVDNFNVPTDLPTDMSVLDLSHNRYIRSLRARDFHNYPELRLITMQGNVIREISVDVFRNLTRLERVDFSGTEFEERQIPEIFTDVNSLREIKGLHVQNISENMFAGLERLTSVALTVDSETISEMLFKDLTLHEIELTVPNCRILPSRLFESGATSLRTVKIIGNRLVALPAQLFQGLSLLHEVYLETDLVHMLPVHMLHGSHTSTSQGEQDSLMNEYLQMLLGGGRVDDLVQESEENYAQLQKLTLLGIDIIGDHVLQELRNLGTLIIQHPLEIHPNAFSDLPRLDHLEVSSFNLSDLNSEWFKDLEFLKALNLSSNHIEFIDGGVLSGLHAAEILDLSHNSISKFNSSAMDSFRNFIKVLDLSNNNITELPPSVFIEMYTLQVLKLQGNRLKLFPSGLFTESSFYDYETSSYDPEEDYYFPPMKDMIEINLSNNELEEVTFYVFNQMGYLKTIDLSNNAITNVVLGNLPESLSMETIDFRNNPLNCSCDLIRISLLVSRSNAEIFGTCETPAFLHGTALADLVEYSNICEPVTVAPELVETTARETTTEIVVTTTAMDELDADPTRDVPNLVDIIIGNQRISTRSVGESQNEQTTVAQTIAYSDVTISTNNRDQGTDSDIFFTVEPDRDDEHDYTTSDMMFLNPDEQSVDSNAYIHYFNEINDESNSNTVDKSGVIYDHEKQENKDGNPFKFNRGSNLNEDKLHELYRAHNPKLERNDDEDVGLNQPDDTVEDHSGSGHHDFDNDIGIHVPKQQAVMPEAVSGEYDYFWVKIVAGTLGSVGMVSGVVMFVVKMRGILYKWDYNTRRLWHF